MKETLECQHCSHLNDVEFSDDYYFNKEDVHFAEFFCEECSRPNGICFKSEHHFYSVDLDGD